MPPIAYFGIESSGLSLVIDLLILFAVVLYLSLIYWTYADARRRIADPMLIACATAASLFPFVGTIVYMILRPPCDYRIERDFVRCPSCLRKLKERCTNCSRPLDRAWTICPYCETDVPAAKPARTAARRGRASASGSPARARAGAEVESDVDALELESAGAARSRAAERAAERAAVRAPEPATFVGEASFASEPASLATEPKGIAEEGTPESAPKPSGRSRSTRRPRTS